MVLVCIGAGDDVDTEIHFVLVCIHMVGYWGVFMVPDIINVVSKSF